MSSEQLSELQLDKLEIATNATKTLNQINGNPFYEKQNEEAEIEHVKFLPKTQCHKCRRIRRRSESVLDEFKQAQEQQSVVGKPAGNSIRLTPGVHRANLKKSPPATVAGYTRKSLLRDPVLKSLHTCLHAPQKQSGARRKLLHTITTNNANAVAAGDIEERSLVSACKGMSDFRDLIEECQALVQPSTKKWTNIRTSSQHQKSIPQNLHKTSQIILPSSSTSTYPNNHSSPRTASPSPTTSCSQQAGNGAAGAACDDVTIDELASYFDTLVHIPKKMSEMAEMMYI